MHQFCNVVEDFRYTPCSSYTTPSALVIKGMSCTFRKMNNNIALKSDILCHYV